jgi:hypothetical protein
VIGGMSTAATSSPPAPPVPRTYDPFAALLSYLVPGLGQIYQGRFGKGLLFMVCLLGMFFFGMYLGSWKNVYLPNRPGNAALPVVNVSWPVALVNDRLAFAGQFWIGIAAWPAVLQYNEKWFVSEQASPWWHSFQQAPSPDELNSLQADPPADKTWDLAWVYTVIAGVLNILVIYDALAGPAFQGHEEHPEPAPVQEAATV